MATPYIYWHSESGYFAFYFVAIVSNNIMRNAITSLCLVEEIDSEIDSSHYINQNYICT